MFVPSTTIKLLHNVDLTNDYSNTLTFNSLAEQTSFFSAKALITLDAQMYQRKNKVIIIDRNCETLYNISYLMFQNSNFGTKWFYAFVTDITYINDNTSAIEYEIDVLQTWLFDYELRTSYVEREHVSDDTIGKHLINEDLNTGDYVNNSETVLTELNNYKILLLSTLDGTSQRSSGKLISGVYTGLSYFIYDITEISALDTHISNLDTASKGNSIVAIIMIPDIFIPSTGFPVGGNSAFTYKELTKNTTSLDGYVPKNNKLFCYPYNFLYSTNFNGGYNNYHYEYFNNPIDSSIISFKLIANISANTTAFLIPTDYKGLDENYDELLKISDFPKCGWTYDVYKNWLTQNSVSNIIGVGSSILNLGVGVATSNPIAISSGVLNVAQTIGNFYEKSLEPPQNRGSSSSGENVGINRQTFGFYNKTVRYEFAKMIDDYFSMFGYKVNELKVPNINSRQNWNYLKLTESNIVGDIPNAHLKKINDIFKNGLTFWHNDNIGNYNRTNDII